MNSPESMVQASTNDGDGNLQPPNGSKPQKGSAFWMSFVAIVVSIFLSALDLTAVGTALPTITAALKGGDDFVWVASAYSLASTAILPLSGSLADIFGRRPIMLISIIFFSLGSALAGAAQNMNMMIGARTIQGIGGGGITSLTLIVISDLVPLSERGFYQGLIGLTWAFASGLGPPVGGLFAQSASWRWLFFLNLPLTAIAFVLVSIFLRVRTPEGTIREKLARIDWFGNMLIIAGSTLAIVGMTFGGVRFPWTSAQVLAPLIIGLTLMAFFLLYEAKFAKNPTVPLEVVSNRTSFGGYMSTAVHGIVSISLIYYMPVYFQASRGASPIRSGVNGLATALVISPFAILSGIIVQLMKKYRPVIAIGWVFMVIGFGLLSLLKADSSVSQWVGYQFLAAAGAGLMTTGTIFPILAPLPVSRTAAAVGFLTFFRSLAQTWGITISGTILQNQLKKKLPPAFLSQFPQGVQISYAAIPKISSLAEPLRTEVRRAFADSMSTIWLTMIGISGLGMISVLFLKEIPMKTVTDEKYGLVIEERGGTKTPSDMTQVSVDKV
ncbi:iron permease [Rickenella mellea]|uniref:Iron permease n=1 Tax=Rickenella mellea TaxID=50990 RepID=A0A4Y7PUP4_9AGAM|nr:iron permease [Rickenella mellea]